MIPVVSQFRKPFRCIPKITRTHALIVGIETTLVTEQSQTDSPPNVVYHVVTLPRLEPKHLESGVEFLRSGLRDGKRRKEAQQARGEYPY